MSNQNCSFYSTDTSLSATLFKNKFKTHVDPILQRTDQYVKVCLTVKKSPEPPKRKYAQNYFERMKEKETTLRIRNNPNHQGSRIFEQSDPNVKVRNAKKRITPPKKEEKNKTQLKMFPISKAKVASLLKSQDLNEELDYSEKKESLRINKNHGKPSEELVRMNNKYQLLPCELEENSNVKVNRASNRLSKSLSTKDRIFLNYNSNITEKEEERKVLKKENPNFIRNNQVSELISYKHGPNFRDEHLTDKPTRTVLRSRIQNTERN